MDYSKLSDFEINGRVARATQKIGDSTQARGKTLIHEHEDVGEFKNICIGWKEFDPCNNAADAWPIIVGNAIGVMPFKKGDAEAWSLSAGLLSNKTVKDKNPLRAAMIVYLMMQEGE